MRCHTVMNNMLHRLTTKGIYLRPMFSIRRTVKVAAAGLGLLLVSCVYIYNAHTIKYIPQVLIKDADLVPFVSNIEHKRYHLFKNHTNYSIPLLTLFTTWSVKDSNKSRIWNTTVRNWAHLIPMVRPVFFYTPEIKLDDILRQGWQVLPVSKTSEYGLPVLKNMFLDAMTKFDSLFYGFSNGDIIFDNGLIDTLRAILHSRVPAKKTVFITGVRTNVANLTENETGDVLNVAKKRGELFVPLAQDYFITDRSYPWQDIPDIVIGRIAYDNWLVLNARQMEHTLIDATETLTAVHQTTQSGNFEGWKHNDTYNIQLLEKHYNTIRFDGGSTACAAWMTKGCVTDHDITIVQREMLEEKCFPLV